MLKLTTNYIITTLRSKGLYYFTPRDLVGIFNLSLPQIYSLLKRLKRGKYIIEIEKGKYFVLGFEPERILANPFFIANKILFPSYLSFWTALNFYGFTEQVPLTIFMASARKKSPLRFNRYKFKYINLSPHKFFGYEKIQYGDLPVLVAEPEKAIIDSLDQLQYAGGLSEIAKCLENACREKNINLSKLISYALKMKNSTLCSRLGFLLERLGIKNKMLLKRISKPFILLDPNRRKSRTWNKKWKINVNLTEQELSEWKET